MSEWIKVSYRIYRINDNDVYCTLIKGDKKALLIDTGYGNIDLKSELLKMTDTPYMVINSHGHPDHAGGNNQFDEVYALKEEEDVISHFVKTDMHYNHKEVRVNDVLDLGNATVEIVSLKGHTRGSIGFILKEERMLIAGDALNEGLWLFNYGSLSMEELYQTLNKTLNMDFDYYLCGHSGIVYQKERINLHIRNIENLKVDEKTKEMIMGFETYKSTYEKNGHKSEIIFTKDKL